MFCHSVGGYDGALWNFAFSMSTSKNNITFDFACK